MAVVTAAVAVGATAIGGAVQSGQAHKAMRGARDAKDAAAIKVEELKNARQTVINPYSGVTDLSSMAEDLSGMMSNPFESLGVATQAAEIQAEEADISLANTLDMLRATGASAGGATALAQAALSSKKGVSASIEQQEAQNERLRAQGEQQAQQARPVQAARADLPQRARARHGRPSERAACVERRLRGAPRVHQALLARGRARAAAAARQQHAVARPGGALRSGRERRRVGHRLVGGPGGRAAQRGRRGGAGRAGGL